MNEQPPLSTIRSVTRTCLDPTSTICTRRSERLYITQRKPLVSSLSWTSLKNSSHSVPKQRNRNVSPLSTISYTRPLWSAARRSSSSQYTDLYGKCARYERLAHALSEYQELVPPLGAELRAAIEQPAQLCGLELEPGLTDLLLQDMRQQPAGTLPLLQQTLLMLWERRAARRLTVTAYNNIGKIEGALEAHANKLYEDVLQSDEEREVCRRVLLMLTNPGEGTEDTRRRATRNQLGSGVTVDSVLQSLAKGRLITIGETEPVQVEVAHEALIRGWHKLREWLDVDRESVRIVHRLADVAEEWRSGDRDPAFLYRGSRLAQAEEWDSSHAKELACHWLANSSTHVFRSVSLNCRNAKLRSNTGS